MAIGVQNSVAGINARAGYLTCQWKALADDLAQFAAPVLIMAVSDLEILGFTLTDATNMAAAAVALNQLSELYYGTATLSSDTDFSAALEPLRGTA